MLKSFKHDYVVQYFKIINNLSTHSDQIVISIYKTYVVIRVIRYISIQEIR